MAPGKDDDDRQGQHAQLNPAQWFMNLFGGKKQTKRNEETPLLLCSSSEPWSSSLPWPHAPPSSRPPPTPSSHTEPPPMRQPEPPPYSPPRSPSLKQPEPPAVSKPASPSSSKLESLPLVQSESPPFVPPEWQIHGARNAAQCPFYRLPDEVLSRIMLFISNADKYILYQTCDFTRRYCTSGPGIKLFEYMAMMPGGDGFTQCARYRVCKPDSGRPETANFFPFLLPRNEDVRRDGSYVTPAPKGRTDWQDIKDRLQARQWCSACWDARKGFWPAHLETSTIPVGQNVWFTSGKYSSAEYWAAKYFDQWLQHEPLYKKDAKLRFEHRQRYVKQPGGKPDLDQRSPWEYLDVPKHGLSYAWWYWLMSKPTECSACRCEHPRIMFPPSERPDPRVMFSPKELMTNSAVCIGRTGHVHICPHVSVKWATLKNWIDEDRAQDEVQLSSLLDEGDDGQDEDHWRLGCDKCAADSDIEFLASPELSFHMTGGAPFIRLEWVVSLSRQQGQYALHQELRRLAAGYQQLFCPHVDPYTNKSDLDRLLDAFKTGDIMSCDHCLSEYEILASENYKVTLTRRVKLSLPSYNPPDRWYALIDPHSYDIEQDDETRLLTWCHSDGCVNSRSRGWKSHVEHMWRMNQPPFGWRARQSHGHHDRGNVEVHKAKAEKRGGWPRSSETMHSVQRSESDLLAFGAWAWEVPRKKLSREPHWVVE